MNVRQLSPPITYGRGVRMNLSLRLQQQHWDMVCPVIEDMDQDQVIQLCTYRHGTIQMHNQLA